MYRREHRRAPPCSNRTQCGRQKIRHFPANILFLCYVCPHVAEENFRMSELAETIPPAPLRNRSIEARRAARLAKARRESRIFDLLNRGVSVAEIAARENVTEKRMRALISEILACRMPEPPAEFVALQLSRLNEALLVAYGAMSGANLRAVDRVVKFVRELDRYHGFSATERRSRRKAPRLKARAQPPSRSRRRRPTAWQWCRNGLK